MMLCVKEFKTLVHVYCSFFQQESMDEACAEGIADEHYRLEGRLCL